MSKENPYVAVPCEPIRVSPLIRFARWAALGAGIVYGAYRYQKIATRHADIREWEAQKIIIRKDHTHHEAILKGKDESEFIMKLANIPLEEGKSALDVEHLYSSH